MVKLDDKNTPVDWRVGLFLTLYAQVLVSQQLPVRWTAPEFFVSRWYHSYRTWLMLTLRSAATTYQMFGRSELLFLSSLAEVQSHTRTFQTTRPYAITIVSVLTILGNDEAEVRVSNASATVLPT